MNYCLGFSACFLVVFIVALVVTVVSKAPLIFLRLSELQRGETDISIRAGDWTGSDALNFSKIGLKFFPLFLFLPQKRLKDSGQLIEQPP